VLPPSLVPPDSAKVTRLATGSEKPPVAAFVVQEWCLLCIVCRYIRIRVSARPPRWILGRCFQGSCNRRDFRYRYLSRSQLSSLLLDQESQRLTFVADTGAGVSSTFVAITEALVHAENAIVEGGVAIAISSSSPGDILARA
jgi:hypothetical protein